MIIKKRQYKGCLKCGAVKMVRDEIHGCDNCKKMIDFNTDTPFLDATIFKSDSSDATHLYFCSWKCALKRLRSIKCDYFINLPYLRYDKAGKGIQAKDFWKLIK